MARKKYPKKKAPPKIVAVGDFETDPFLYGRVPEPFIAEIYSREHNICEVFEGADCVDKMVDWLRSYEEPLLIYFHNGGRFDVFMFIEHIDETIKVINNRIVECRIGIHVIRDSLAIIPIALKQFDKDDIDYWKMEKDVRHKHMPEIKKYLHKDCTSLYDLVFHFVERFGPKLTVGQTAIGELQKFHTFKRMDETTDNYFRKYYFGGRVQCFESGIIDEGWPVKMYDVNSEYPAAMRNFRHPVNCAFKVSRKLPSHFDVPFFAEIEATNRGALPYKMPDHLDFDVSRETFHVTSHELKVALEFGLIDIHAVNMCYIAEEHISFGEFVDHFYKEKVDCKLSNDKIGELFAKFMLNSAYGKFGSNPREYKDWFLYRGEGDIPDGYSCQCEFDEYELWAKPATLTKNSFFDVSIAASITSAARSIMLRGIQHADRPLYCDTDSIMCRNFHGEISKEILGAWKFEGEAQRAAIAGKKLYSLHDRDVPKHYRPKRGGISIDARETEKITKTLKEQGKTIKYASKGGTLNPYDIEELCRGGTIEQARAAPNFGLTHDTRFITRKFRKLI